MNTAVLAQARWPAGSAADDLPQIAGFVDSAFSPLVAMVADLCLCDFYGAPPATPAHGERTAIVLASTTGDLPTAAAVARAVQAGRRVPPLLFYQSNPNAVAGHVAARWGLSGPVVCTMPGDSLPAVTTDASSRALAEARAAAGILIGAGDADAALVVAANAYLDGSFDGAAELIGPPWWCKGAHDEDPRIRSCRVLRRRSRGGGLSVARLLRLPGGRPIAGRQRAAQHAAQAGPDQAAAHRADG